MLLTSSANAETLSIDAIVALKAAGLSDEVVVSKIKTTHGQYDSSAEALIYLNERGISSDVISAMLEKSGANSARQQREASLTAADPMVPHPPGLYMLHEQGIARMQRIDPSVSSQAKSGGIIGHVLSGGIATKSVKVSIANPNAKTIAQSNRPIFYFFFDEANATENQNFSAWTSGATAIATSPNEFTLVELMRKKGRREARVGSVNVAGAKFGVMDKDRLNFDSEMVRQGVYRVRLSENLPAGEYAFLQTMPGNGTVGATSARIFDFRVK